MNEQTNCDAVTRTVACTDLTSNLFVEAGAGTGKTTLLVSRLVAMVNEERPLGTLAAITFTEKAAAELRDRFRSKLVESGRLDVARQIDDAQISTIHGFARAILARHALEAGLPPEFSVLDQLAASVEFDRRFDEFVDDLYDPDGDSASVIRLMLTMGSGRRHLRQLVEAVEAARHRFEGVEFEPPPPLPYVESIVDELADVSSLRHHCLAVDDKLALHLGELDVWIDELRRVQRSAETGELLRLLAARKVTCGFGRTPNWPSPVTKEAVLARLNSVQLDIEAARRQVGHHVVTSLLPLIVEFVGVGAVERRQAGTLTFEDLLIETRRVLATNSEVREQISNRWPHVLVDEFQDTDDLQIDIITLICSVDDKPEALAWNERTLGAGALFAVGDPKQSIYRFRGADMRLYQAAAAAFGGGEPLVLDRNFRTVPGVLAWVNDCVGALFDPMDTAQAVFHELAAARDPIGVGPSVEVLGVDAHPGLMSAVRSAEADDVVRTLMSYRREGLPALDGQGCRAPVAYADMAILLPTRTALGAIEAALEAHDVPYRIDSRSLVFSTPEVRTMAVVLRAIDDPGDAIAVVGALRSPAFGCSDAALLAWRDGGGSWDPRRAVVVEAAAADITVPSPMAVLREFIEQRWWMSLPELVMTVVDRCHLRDVCLAHRRAQDRWRRLQFVVDEAIKFESVGGRELRLFVDWLDEQHASERQDTETVVADLDDDAVRILTVHASKGLEYRVVALAGLGARERTDVPVLAWSDKGLPLARIGAGEGALGHPDLPAAAELARALDRAEAFRLLYVATTRARDHLVVSLHRSEKNSGSLPAAALAGLLGPSDGVVGGDEVMEEADVHGSRATTFGAPPAPEEVLRCRAEYSRRHELVLRSPVARVVAATALSADLHDGPHMSIGLDDDRSPWRRGRAGTSIGRAVHAVLQSVDLATGSGVERISLLHANAEGVSESATEIIRLVRHVLAAPVVIEASQQRHWREVFVSVPIDGLTIEGFIDLLVERPDGSLIVVDYKTDSVRSEDEITSTMSRYRLQGAAYALAVAETLQRVVSDVVFVFARSGTPVTQRSLPDLRPAISEVRTLLGTRHEQTRLTTSGPRDIP